MDTTIKLYDTDAYQTRFTAVVLSCEEAMWGDTERGEAKRYLVRLNQTLFFPEEGGQSPDKGQIQGIDVLDVQIKQDEIIHTLATPLEIGEEVEGVIDWTHRFSNMQQHTGEHIFSGLVNAKYGYDNVGFHLSDQSVTMDFSGVLSEAEVSRIEWEVNQCIVKNIAVEAAFPSRGDLENLEYRSKIEIDGPVRIVTIPGYDVCACCAPHVRRTGEIGQLKVLGVQNHRGGVRINILCGFRALEDYRSRQENVVKISNLLSVQQELVAEAVAKLKCDYASLKQELGSVKQEMMLIKIEQIPSNQRNVCLFEQELEADVMRAAVNALVKDHEGYCAVFAGTDETGYRYIVGSAEEDSREMGNILKEKFQAKGGGKPEMIQGSLRGTHEAIESIFEYL